MDILIGEKVYWTATPTRPNTGILVGTGIGSYHTDSGWGQYTTVLVLIDTGEIIEQTASAVRFDPETYQLFKRHVERFWDNERTLWDKKDLFEGLGKHDQYTDAYQDACKIGNNNGSA